MKRNNESNAKKITILIVLIILYIEPQAAMKKKDGLIYVLIWSSDRFIKAILMQKKIADHNCKFQNCYITDNANYFKDKRVFDAVLFDIKDLYRPDSRDLAELPEQRFKHQLYIFFSMESAEKFPVTDALNNFFNLTWTYRLDSDVTFPFIEVKDINDKVVGPKTHVQWLHHSFMKEPEIHVKNKLQNKSLAAAWIVSNCVTKNKRREFVHNLNHELNKYGHNVDIFGLCGRHNCSTKRVDKCFRLIERDYYFYLAFESTFSKDLVTTKVMYAWKHFAIPVVYGGADYSRFLPEGSYLDARDLGPQKLAKEMSDIIADKRIYYEFFKWHRYYSIQSTAESWYLNQICEFCKLLNHVLERNVTTVFHNLAGWWNSLDKPAYYPPATEKPLETNAIKEILLELYDKYFNDS